MNPIKDKMEGQAQATERPSRPPPHDWTWHVIVAGLTALLGLYAKHCSPHADVTPAVLIEQGIPSLLASHRDTLGLQKAVVSLTLTGTGGGEWTVDVPAGAVNRGISARATAGIEMSVHDFQALLNGSLDVVEAVRKGEIVVTGDANDIEALGRLISKPPPKREPIDEGRISPIPQRGVTL